MVAVNYDGQPKSTVQRCTFPPNTLTLPPDWPKPLAQMTNHIESQVDSISLFFDQLDKQLHLCSEFFAIQFYNV